MTHRQFAASAAFVFVATWAGFGLGTAILCALAGTLGWLAVGIAEGDIDLGEVQDRVTRN